MSDSLSGSTGYEGDHNNFCINGACVYLPDAESKRHWASSSSLGSGPGPGNDKSLVDNFVISVLVTKIDF